MSGLTVQDVDGSADICYNTSKDTADNITDWGIKRGCQWFPITPDKKGFKIRIQKKEEITMPFPIYLGWGLLVPAGLSLLYDCASHNAMIALGYQQKNTIRERFWNFLPAFLLFLLWGMINIPLPFLYILAYLGKLSLLFYKSVSRARGLFLINLTHLTTIALHMILISLFSLLTGIQMNDLLSQPFWRIATIGILLAANTLTACMVPRWGMIMEVLRTQAESEEVRPFIKFLWFCNIFLMLDSVLCISDIDWKLLPVFLIGSTVLLEFYLIRFLSHIYQLLKVNYLEAEHNLLLEKLEQQNKNAAELRSKIVLDPMTGIFTRRYAIERVEFLLQEKEPFSLVFIDLDQLKQINDREGHHAGDLYLTRFTKELGSCLRKADIFARVGGDEFVVLLPGCPLKTARKRFESIRGHLAVQCRPSFAFSYGITYVMKNSGDSVEQILRRADQAMYQDKQARS